MPNLYLTGFGLFSRIVANSNRIVIYRERCEWAASARAGVRYLFANRSRIVMVPQTCTHTWSTDTRRRHMHTVSYGTVWIALQIDFVILRHIIVITAITVLCIDRYERIFTQSPSHRFKRDIVSKWERNDRQTMWDKRVRSEKGKRDEKRKYDEDDSKKCLRNVRHSQDESPFTWCAARVKINAQRFHLSRATWKAEAISIQPNAMRASHTGTTTVNSHDVTSSTGLISFLYTETHRTTHIHTISFTWIGLRFAFIFISRYIEYERKRKTKKSDESHDSFTIEMTTKATQTMNEKKIQIVEFRLMVPTYFSEWWIVYTLCVSVDNTDAVDAFGFE